MAETKTKKKKILVAEDDQALGDTIKVILMAQNFEVTHVLNGAEARNNFVLEKYDLVLSDIRMPDMNGIELLHFIKRTNDTPVILMTGFAEINEAKEAYDLGAKGFLPKPFSKTALLEEIARFFGEEKPLLEDLDEQFMKIKIDEFISGKEMQFDIFIRISNTKYIKFALGGESIDIQRIKKYSSMGIEYLYIRREDFRRYAGFSLNVAQKVMESNKIERDKKVKFIQHTSKSVLENLYHTSLDKEQFVIAHDLVLNTVDMMIESPDILYIFEMLKDHNDKLFAHSHAVSLYATMMARAIGWNSLKTKVTVSMCGLFHDIGLKEIPREIVDKPRAQRSAEETKIFETHSNRGMEVLNSLPHIPSEVAQAALYHHEDCKGLGYPLHVTKPKIPALSRLIYVANEFCSLVHPSSHQIPCTPDEAVKRLANSDLSRMDGEFFKGLLKIIKV
jgi:putative nucleotidyltransferase with HDIG domain